MLGESDEVEGVLKVNSRILEAHQLRKLDKSEKSLVNAIHTAGKGKELDRFFFIKTTYRVIFRASCLASYRYKER